MFDPTDGSSPLGADPYEKYQYSSSNVPDFVRAGSTEAQGQQAWNDFVKEFGRNPTQNELDMLTGAYATSDPNRTNPAQGKQAIAQYYQSLANTPANIYAAQQKQWAAAAPQHYDSVNQITQSLLGRKATQDELDHYGTLIASGQADPYQIQQFVQATPEYQNAQDTQFRQGVDTQLQKSDSDFFNTQKGNIAQQYAQMGRATSPALDVALTQLASQLNSNRQSYLAQLSASQYGGNKQAALGNYENTQNQVQGQINQNTQGIYGANQALNTRLNNITDYNTQATAWQNGMNQYGNKGPGALDYLNAAFNGVSAGAKAYAAGK
jgi:hypothetical protein